MTLRLALVGPTHPYKGGIAQHTTELAHRLAARPGVEVEVWSWRRQYPARLYPGEQRVAGSVPESPPFPATSEPLSWDRPLGWLAAGRRARREGFDAVVLTWTTPVQAPPYVGLLRGLGVRHRGAWTLRGIPTVALCHNVLPHEPRRLDRRLTRAVLVRCAGLLVHSAAQAEVASGLGVPGQIAIAALPPPALPALPAAAANAAAVRDAGGLQLLQFGLVRPYKGLEVLLEALARPEVPGDVRLVVAGEFWTPVEQLRARAAALGLADRVELRPGYVAAADLPELFSAADAVVLPYVSATSSIVPDLAHRHGRPVVVTRAGTLADTVRDGVDGLVVPPADPVALAAALVRLAAPGERERLRAGVAPQAREERWEPYVDALLALCGAG